ncbi:MAG TPA: FAD binding domain-containing protein [Acidobacteriaceae bacterium]|jgi:CO/xanthine dehydrogenase FAD-binding subunit|nr:FAD binding domain-containing protein [Acidobacteriaceae bacterium]
MRSNVAEYEIIAPRTLEGVLQTLAGAPGEYMPVAGGTEVMVMLGAGTLKAKKLVSLWGLEELRFVRETAEMLTIGAGTTYTDIRRSKVIAEEFPLLTQAASWTGSIANQNRGTLGGNIVNASPAADSPPALLAYGAELVLVSARGERTIPYTEFHLGYKKTALAMDELLLAVRLPRRFAGYFQSSRKVGARRAQAISKVAMALVAKLEDGVVADIAIGGASLRETPIRCTATEQALLGRRLDAATIAAARTALAEDIAPIDDIRSTARYRAHVAGNLLDSMLVELSS